MMDIKTFTTQMFTPGTIPCTIFGAILGIIFAVLCLTIGVGKALLIGVFGLIGAFLGGVGDKSAFVKHTILIFHKDEEKY